MKRHFYVSYVIASSQSKTFGVFEFEWHIEQYPLKSAILQGIRDKIYVGRTDSLSIQSITEFSEQEYKEFNQ